VVTDQQSYHPTDSYRTEQPPPVRAFERHFQTGLAALLIGLVFWVGITVTGNREHISRLDERLKSQGAVLSEIKEEFKDRAVPVMEIPHLQEQIGRLRDRHRTLAERVTKLEESFNRGSR
jgi:hypothetical protein